MMKNLLLLTLLTTAAMSYGQTGPEQTASPDLTVEIIDRLKTTLPQAADNLDEERIEELLKKIEKADFKAAIRKGIVMSANSNTLQTIDITRPIVFALDKIRVLYEQAMQKLVTAVQDDLRDTSEIRKRLEKVQKIKKIQKMLEDAYEDSVMAGLKEALAGTESPIELETKYEVMG